MLQVTPLLLGSKLTVAVRLRTAGRHGDTEDGETKTEIVATVTLAKPDLRHLSLR